MLEKVAALEKKNAKLKYFYEEKIGLEAPKRR